jgi:hypothetical protein
MAIQSKRANEIDAYIEAHKSCIKGKQKVEINGKIEPLDSYILPLSLLQYNHDNRRFNFEIQEHEDSIGRRLDPSDKQDVEKIKELLLADKIEAEKLYSDLKQLGEQREVAAITHDGIVVNGNRRMATIEKLHKENATGKWNELWVIRLPSDISERDLWKIEAGLQLSKEKVADYGPVNNLLMINEGRKAGLSELEIAASMYGWTEKQVKSDLERLTLIDIFLQFMGQPNNYGLIKRFSIHQHFEELQKNLVEKQRSLGTSKKELTKKLEYAFLYLRAHVLHPDVSITYHDIRTLCKILQDEQATLALTDSFDSHKDIHKVPVVKLIDNFDRANDIKKNREDSKKPAKLIERAIAALNGVDRKGKHYKEDKEVKNKLQSLSNLVEEMKKELGIK